MGHLKRKGSRTCHGSLWMATFAWKSHLPPQTTEIRDWIITIARMCWSHSWISLVWRCLVEIKLCSKSRSSQLFPFRAPLWVDRYKLCRDTGACDFCVWVSEWVSVCVFCRFCSIRTRVFVCVCVCVWETEKERERERERESERERERERERECVW